MAPASESFAKEYSDLITSLEQSLRLGIEQADTFQTAFPNVDQSQSSNPVWVYINESRPIHRVERVREANVANPSVFEEGTDYEVLKDGDRVTGIKWHPGIPPNPGAELAIDYIYRERPSDINDLNEGSIVATLVRVMAREFKLLYQQMDEAYRRAFIDEASGQALDNVVALLGVTRKEAQKAKGEATFIRSPKATSVVTVPKGTRIETANGKRYVTIESKEMFCTVKIERVEGLKMRNRVALIGGRPAIEGVWKSDPTNMDGNGTPGSPLTGISVDQTDQQSLHIDNGIDFPFWVTYHPESIKAEVEAVEAGSQGDTGSNTLIPKSLPWGVTGIRNERPIIGGIDAEDDEMLRERARHQLEREANATLDALRFAVLEVPGVRTVKVQDFTSDKQKHLGEVDVYFEGDKESNSEDKMKTEVERKVDKTRAAGIKVNVKRLGVVWFKVTLNVKFVSSESVSNKERKIHELRKRILAFVNSLQPGEMPKRQDINGTVYQIGGLSAESEPKIFRCISSGSDCNSDGIWASIGESKPFESTEIARIQNTQIQLTFPDDDPESQKLANQFS